MPTDFVYLGHSTFYVKTGNNTNILIDPWIDNNPSYPKEYKLEKVDILLITHGHFDHIGDAVRVAKEYKPKVVCVFETSVWLNKKGVENTLPMNKGGTQTVNGIKITMVSADHSCGILDDDGSIIYGGEPCGYVVTLEDGFIFYHAGDTNVFNDMKTISLLYKPKLALLPIGDLYTMSPKEAAYACSLLKPKMVIPMHYGTFPVLTGTPEELKRLVRKIKVKVIELKPGETKSF